MPLSGSELGPDRLPQTLDAMLLGGGYPALYDRPLAPTDWFRDATTIETHAARGALFETWVVSELVKQRFNAGQRADLYFWRDNVGHEVVLETPQGLQAVRKWTGMADPPTLMPIIIFGGTGRYVRQDCSVMGWREFVLA